MRRGRHGAPLTRSWSPYAAGAAIGALDTLAMATAKRPIGITTAFEHTAVLAAERLAPEATKVKRFERARGDEAKIDWEWMLVAGVAAGSALSAALSGDRPHSSMAARWRGRVSESRLARYGAAMAGGALMMFGARMAKGCTSGHGISGTMQLAASSWLFTPVMFASGALVARALYGRPR